MCQNYPQLPSLGVSVEGLSEVSGPTNAFLLRNSENLMKQTSSIISCHLCYALCTWKDSVPRIRSFAPPGKHCYGNKTGKMYR